MQTLKTELIRYFEQLEADAHFAFMEVQQDTRKGNIHALRVSLKRLRAFLHMLSEVDPHFPGKASLKRFKSLFAEAGQLRDLQIENSLLYSKEETLELTHKTSDQLLSRIEEQQRAFRAFEQAFSIAGLRETCLQARSHLEHMHLSTLRKGLRGYFRNMLDELTILAREGMSSKKRLHELRKSAKEALYNLIAIDQATPHVMLSMDLMQPLEMLQHQLGKWHDHCMTKEESKNLRNVPQSLKRQLKQDETRYLQDIRFLLAQLPTMSDRLLEEMDTLLAPVKQEMVIETPLN
ncbi:MAG: CHAD domain-containing protein [Saprospirales bacterium]|nr:CHAD domain-containing protein [Saprospirales bacterium]MBK8492415.1 CHAD domain-containing protein [Saprospirales bacterium]